MAEEVVAFECAGSQTIGILHTPEIESAPAHLKCAIVIPVGGPQYRVGSHRQFVVIARQLAAAGYPVFRFDYRGMGDTEGEPRTFEFVEEDVLAALAAVRVRFPDRGIIWLGLCDAASVILMYSRIHARTLGVVLLNPWVRSEVSLARAHAKHYYGARLLSRDFWAQVLRLKWDYQASIRSLLQNLATVLRRSEGPSPASFVQRMQHGLATLTAPALVVLSDKDLTAREFGDLIESDPVWRQLTQHGNVSVERLLDSDHTLSSSRSLGQFMRILFSWLEARSDRANA